MAFREVCRRCLRPASACWCAHVTPRSAGADLVLLQHPREARKPIGTARMAHLGVSGSRLLVGVRFAGLEAVAPKRDGLARRAVVLYPAEDAQDVAALREVADPLTVIVLDGTWWQARKLWRENPWLHALPAYRVNPRAAGRYRIRREPAPHCLSTVEAVAALLDALDGRADGHADLLRPFDAMVEKQLARGAGSTRSPRTHVRPATVPPAPAAIELARHGERLVIVHGESNGWPASAEPGRVELLQWEALRPSTGERLHALLRPCQPLAPRVLEQLGLSPEDLAASGLSREAFAAALDRIERPEDVWCAWGHFPFTLMGERATARARIDLRAVCSAHAGERLGSIEGAYRQIVGGPDPASPHGRGGRRMAQLAAIVERLL